jgi:hypothetical protein
LFEDRGTVVVNGATSPMCRIAFPGAPRGLHRVDDHLGRVEDGLGVSVTPSMTAEARGSKSLLPM